MNKQNIKTYNRAGKLWAEWSDRSLDDEDRYAGDSIIIKVSVPKEQGEKALWSAMALALDEWMRDTRGSS